MTDTHQQTRTQRRLEKLRAASPPKRRTYAEQAVRMDRFDVISFADLTGPKGGEWVKIGGGSFGVVYRGEYLGTEVAIKEVLANNTYDVEKYFERECVLMKEARHPNIVQYIGLTKSPGADGRIYIISEFVGGNLRSYLADKRKPFDWPLRMSFATDIARAVAYLHARNCLHRDLKGENLLITANDRIKVCDFGFARIAARNEDEMRRISYCGTDGYMSPEILTGVDFSLPSDVFSLGVIFCEILSRHLVDSNTFKRQVPSFGLDAAEVREMASKGCPERFIQLSLDCVDEDPCARPDMREVIRRLREIEQEVLAREAQTGTLRSVGSLRGASLAAVVGSKASKRGGRPMPPRLPSFSGQIQVSSSAPIREEPAHSRESSGSESDEDMTEALAALEKVGINTASLDGPEPALGTITSASTFKVSGHGNPWWSDESTASLPTLRSSWVRKAIPVDDSAKAAESKSDDEAMAKSGDSQYSTSVVRPSKTKEAHAPLPMTMSAHTIGREAGRDAAADVSESSITVRGHEAAPTEEQPLLETAQAEADPNSGDEEVAQSFMTARSRRQEASLAMATICSSIHSGHGPLYHRFTLIKIGMKRPASLGAAAAAAASGNVTASQVGGSLLPPGIMFANALSKCHVCGRRLGFAAFMDCDDCPYKTHAGCAEYAEPTCQEMAIPTTPVLTPVNASRRGSRGAASPALSAGSRAQSPATAALAKAAAAMGQQQQRTSSPPLPPPTASTQSSSGRSLWKGRRDKRASKSPPSSAAPVARA